MSEPRLTFISSISEVENDLEIIGCTVWLTGLPGSGKSTIVDKLETVLRERGANVEILDGDEVRRNLSPDLGFTKEDRETHARRVVYVSKLLSRNGVIVLVALISPYRAFRENARKQIGSFVEVFVRCPLEVCIERDPKGLYKKAMAGEIKDLTGLQDVYEEPLNPEIIVDTDKLSVDESVVKITEELTKLKYLERLPHPSQ